MKTSELQGAAIDWAVEEANGGDHTYNPRGYSTDWAFGGPIIEREKIQLGFGTMWSASTINQWPVLTLGETPLLAGMRCYVASKLGEEVEIPEDLK